MPGLYRSQGPCGEGSPLRPAVTRDGHRHRPALDQVSANPRTRHTVTAIIISHDGARLLPSLVRALRAQTYKVEQTVAVDTGSRDRSGAVLAELIGHDAVFGMDRSASYGEAVSVALRHATRHNRPPTPKDAAPFSLSEFASKVKARRSE